METQSNQEWKKYLKPVGAIIATLAILALVFFGGISYQKKKTSVAEDYLRKQIEAYEKEARVWKDKYEASLKEKTALLGSVDSLETEIKKLKKSYGQKTTIIMSYSNPELERFFAERYGN